MDQSNRNAHSTRWHRARGFSLLEMVMVIAITIIVACFAVLSMVPVMNAQHAINAYNTTISALRQGRDNAISQRTSYSVTFSSSTVPNTVVVAPTLTFSGDLPTATYQLPTDVTYQIQTAYASTTPPDGYGSGVVAIDFGYPSPGTGTGGQTVVYFCPDGSAQNSTSAGNCSGMNNWSGGVIYLSRGTDLLSSRAVSIWGGTGRIHGWRLYTKSGGYQWLRD
ncbi:MAG: prepilin-type N-terminal cleavage/methylation domain-containing protein [Terriglobales bacterium]|jgi:prepilin-type N-terminal cleavage/methylation domain-containing protein